eukprot:TRINITY_DN61397_c0_g1_i1.p1 TRINITY_DN61397_c0_g1~~TRINITY_DN61397_c0_g1_i1.p1  ORF type:complete len:496 (+),score=182.04 TRINITY_DN61397_c0_g1_i1:104-1489(+)
MPKVHWQMRMDYIGAAASAVMLATIATTYTLCVHQGNCPVFLPTISRTWDFAPGSYISRFVVGNVAMLMGLAQFAFYWIDNKGFSKTTDLALLVTGVTSCFLLSVVGAVCSSTAPSCRGSHEVHGVSAVSFFLGYNACMIAISVAKPASALETLLAVASCLAKARFLDIDLAGMLGAPESFPLLAVVEWTDVAIICAWTVLYLFRKGPTLRVALVDTAGSGEAPAPLTHWSMRAGAIAVWVLYVGTVTSTALIFYLQGRWPAKGLPYISDTWVYPPGDWISRWAIVACASIAAVVHVCAYFVEVDYNQQPPKGVLGRTCLACVAFLGAAAVACVNETENGTIHTISAGTFFVGYDAFMLLTALQYYKGGRGGAPATAAVCTAAVWSVLSKVRFTAAFGALSASVGISDMPQVIEWTDATAVAVFFAVYFGSFGEHLKEIGVQLYRADSPSEGKELPLLPIV